MYAYGREHAGLDREEALGNGDVLVWFGHSQGRWPRIELKLDDDCPYGERGKRGEGKRSSSYYLVAYSPLPPSSSLTYFHSTFHNSRKVFYYLFTVYIIHHAWPSVRRRPQDGNVFVAVPYEHQCCSYSYCRSWQANLWEGWIGWCEDFMGESACSAPRTFLGYFTDLFLSRLSSFSCSYQL